MAETDAAAGGAKHGLDFLKTKMGPLPLGVWLGIALAVYVYYSRKNSSGVGDGNQTDPAGNVGTINPQTGYVAGSPEDKAALAGSSGTTSDTQPSGSTVAGAYPDNNAWGRAAVNYLVSLGVDPTSANEAIQNYLTSQKMTTQQQATVNLAVQGLGPPPDLPGPVGTAPGPVVTPPPGTKPPGTTYASNPPKGFAVTKKTKTTVSLKWNKVAHATGYTVAYSTKKGGQEHKATTPASKTSITIGNLKHNTPYYFEVWANPTKSGGPHAGPILGHTTK